MAAQGRRPRTATARACRRTHGGGLWYWAAAERGFSDAQFNLGLMCRGGKGVPQDYVTADMWFNLAATGNQDALQERVAETQKLAREWKPRPN
jgi:TPR repeat protein